MKQFGLIGKTLKHSFSKKYFSDKFLAARIENCQYDLYELPDISAFPDLLNKHKNFAGINVTIPYKQEVMQYLDELDENAEVINAVNTIKFLPNGKLKGYNTDYFGFKSSLEAWNLKDVSALVLGTGGASKAIMKVLSDLNIPFQLVSRTKTAETITYDELHEQAGIVKDHWLIVNTSPVGTFPNETECPNLPYDEIGANHLLFDLVYNPEITLFMQNGLDAGAKVKNGYEMLVGQAEASWSIWNK